MKCIICNKHINKPVVEIPCGGGKTPTWEPLCFQCAIDEGYITEKGVDL